MSCCAYEAFKIEHDRDAGYSQTARYHEAMSESDDIISPLEDAPAAKRKKRSWIIWLFDILVLIFAAFHLYALALKFIPNPGTILMAQRAMSGENVKRDWTRIEDISPYLVSAVISGEDARFCQHDGIDWDAVQDAMSDNQSRTRRRGGSTITQQTAKNVFLWNGGGFIRKVPETWMASFIDFAWGKKRVLEMYLNVAEWGDGLFGAEAAAQARFGISAKDLSPRQAALLASVLPSPNKWRLDPPGEYVNGRTRTLQARLYVVRNEGYADCVLGKAKKRIGPKPAPVAKPKSSPEPEKELVVKETDETEIEAEEKQAEVAAPKPSPVQDPPAIVEEVLEPIEEQTPETQPEEEAPESEADTGIEIKPENP